MSLKKLKNSRNSIRAPSTSTSTNPANDNLFQMYQFARVCCLVNSDYNARGAMQEIGPTSTPQILPPSLEYDMSINFHRKFEEAMDMVLVPFIPHYQNSQFAGGPMIMEEDKPLAMELALSSVDQLIKMCQASDLLWINTICAGKEVLNVEEYSRMFPWPVGIKQNSYELKVEATCSSAVVIMNSITLVDAFLDASQNHSSCILVGFWTCEWFSSIDVYGNASCYTFSVNSRMLFSALLPAECGGRDLGHC